jgi:hypothetical protein
MTSHPGADLKKRFAQWALVYGGEQYRRLGFANLDRIGGPAANDDADTGARELENIVQTMEKSGRWKEARVLRAEYFMATSSEAIRLAKLRRLGLIVSRASYYIYLKSARDFVAGALTRR